MTSNKIRSIFFFSSILFLFPLCLSSAASSSAADLTALSLEELVEMEVVSVSKTPQRRFNAPAAIYVITQEDIRRSGVTNFPDALRLAPGVEVARINSSQWSVCGVSAAGCPEAPLS